MGRFSVAFWVLFLAGQAVSAGDKVIDLSLRDLSGNKVRLRDYRGNIVVLNFWATWCGPCREEMPRIAAAAKQWTPKGVTFITISLDEASTRRDIPTFIEMAHSDVPVWTGASVDDLEKFGLGDGIPDTIFLNENGVIVFRVLGEIRDSELQERLDWLMNGRKGPAPDRLVRHI